MALSGAASTDDAKKLLEQFFTKDSAQLKTFLTEQGYKEYYQYPGDQDSLVKFEKWKRVSKSKAKGPLAKIASEIRTFRYQGEIRSLQNPNEAQWIDLDIEVASSTDRIWISDLRITRRDPEMKATLMKAIKENPDTVVKAFRKFQSRANDIGLKEIADEKNWKFENKNGGHRNASDYARFVFHSSTILASEQEALQAWVTDNKKPTVEFFYRPARSFSR